MHRVSVLSGADLSVTLGGLPVLRGIDVEVDAGRCVALMGPNGSGKSTLVKALLGLLPLSRGRAELFGMPVGDFRQWHRVGYVPQRSTLTMQSASVAEVVGSGLLARRRPFLPLPGTRARVGEALGRVGLAERADAAMTTLSGGQQQRVLIGRALVGAPDLLVLDEPLAGVDRENQERIGQVVADFLGAGGTVAVVLHEAGPFGPLLDRAVVLQDGRVVHDGDAAALPAFGRHEHEPDSGDGWFASHLPQADGHREGDR